MPHRPNILLIQSDQHRFDCVGVNGHPLLRTPHLDRLAHEGVNFTSAYCPIAVCAPARVSLMTGLWPTQHGCLANWDTEIFHGMAEKFPTWSEALKQVGYRLGYVGKWHVDERREPEKYGFSEYIPYSEYYPWRKAQGLPDPPRVAEHVGGVDVGVQPDQTRLGWGATQTLDMMRRYAHAARDGGPFFLRWDPPEPHLPNTPPEPFASMYPPEAIAPWPSFPDTLAGKPFIQAQQRRSWNIDGWDWPRFAPIVSRYLATVSLLDAQVGRLLAGLDELGIADNTLVVYSTDHGDLCGGHGMMDKHYVMYDEVMRVPLIARWPGRLPAGSRRDDFVCGALDLASTFCAAAGAPTPDTFKGKNLLAGETGRPDIFATYHGNQFGLYTQRMVRDRRWKYIWNATAEDELYDVASDPGERRNCAGDGACAAELSRLRGRLWEWMKETGDPLANGWVKGQLLEGRKA